MNFEGKTIALGVCGGIAAYRACDLIRELYRRGAHRVVALMTPSAQEFITPLTLQALTREPVHTSALAVDAQGTPIHIAMAQQADALLILPATANTMARMAQGLADDLVSTTALTFTDKPLLIAPAMNTRMWRNPLTQQNVRTLASLEYVTVIPPSHGELACGETGAGHLASQEMILQQLYRRLHPQAGLYQGVKVLVTAGGTREPIDPVRAIANRSSGKMGVALADELYAMGAEVTLITANDPLERPYPVTKADRCDTMGQAVDAHYEEADLVIMAAAVSDYQVLSPKPGKIKRRLEPSLTVELGPTRDILATLGQRKRPGQVLVGFAAESENIENYALDKLTRKNLDAIVTNDISRSDIGFQADENEVTILFRDRSPVFVSKSSKAQVANTILRSLAPLQAEAAKQYPAERRISAEVTD